MTLGARTGSSGSFSGGAAAGAPAQCAPTALRRLPKPLPTVARIGRLCVNRELGMLFLLLVSLLVLLAQLIPIYKDLVQNSRRFQDISPSFGTRWPHVTDYMHKVIDPKQKSAKYENKILPSAPIRPRNTIPFRHPCDKFSFPPPPLDKKLTGSRPCPVCYVPVEQAMTFMPTSPSVSPSLRNLSYLTNEDIILPNLDVLNKEHGSEFGGYPSLKQRNDSFDIKDSMIVHCGFAKGKKPGHGTGFDIDDLDLLEMEQCHGVVVASAIFGNYDVVQQPSGISEAAKTNVCFFMFVDEETEAYMKNSSGLDNIRRVGLWRMVVVHNLPYTDARRTGKIPKLLLHRLFPNVRFSLWIDGKLKLVVDPYQILERFLWRENATFAISKHYKRFDVFKEAEANKAAGKYDNASIDHQIEFYKREGLTRYSKSKLPITSDVPEGCVIIREHIPITNLFTCLWFNEVERFTARDQLSFSIVRDNIMSKVNWSLNMFEDCERRNFVVQAYHRELLEKRSSSSSRSHPPPAMTNLPRKILPHKASDNFVGLPAKKAPPVKHAKDSKSGSRRRRHRYGTDVVTGLT